MKLTDELRRLAKVEAQRDALLDEIQTHSAAVYECTRLLAEAREQRDALLEALRVFVSCASPVSTEIDERGHRWIEAYLDQALPIARAAIKAVEEGK